MTYSDPERKREADRRYREANRERIREKQQRHRKANPERAREYASRQREAGKRTEYMRQWREVNRERRREYDQQRTAELRAAVLGHYGAECACCGTTEQLVIDHVNGGGNEHRKELFGHSTSAGVQFYYWLIRQGFPDGYQTLCKPCNASKADGSACRLSHRNVAARGLEISQLGCCIRDRHRRADRVGLPHKRRCHHPPPLRLIRHPKVPGRVRPAGDRRELVGHLLRCVHRAEQGDRTTRRVASEPHVMPSADHPTPVGRGPPTPLTPGSGTPRLPAAPPAGQLRHGHGPG